RHGGFNFLSCAFKICWGAVVRIFDICAFGRLLIKRAHLVNTRWVYAFGEQPIDVSIIHCDKHIGVHVLRAELGSAMAIAIMAGTAQLRNSALIGLLAPVPAAPPAGRRTSDTVEAGVLERLMGNNCCQRGAASSSGTDEASMYLRRGLVRRVGSRR